MPAEPVYATILLGGRREPFLRACLESIRGSVDLVVVDVNGECPGNVEDLESSELFREGRLRHEFRPFQGFAAARNHALEMLPPGAAWILKVDADEVHYPEGLRLVTRTLLPALDPGVGVVDAYCLQFMQSFRYFTGVDRRHDLLMRRTPEMHYSGDVHEKTSGLAGRRVVVPYVYGHYGYVRHPGEVLDKWKHYADLGDASYPREELEKAVGEGYLDEEAQRCMPFPGAHPAPLEGLRRDWEGGPTSVRRFDALMAGRVAKSAPRLRQRLRILWRSLPLWPRVGAEGRRALRGLMAGIPF